MVLVSLPKKDLDQYLQYHARLRWSRRIPRRRRCLCPVGSKLARRGRHVESIFQRRPWVLAIPALGYVGDGLAPTYKTSLPNALHFRRGIQNMRVRDVELQIPLPPRKDDPTKPGLIRLLRCALRWK